jgi:transcriptional regulator with GAF, ATPase, and Fis domain
MLGLSQAKVMKAQKSPSQHLIVQREKSLKFERLLSRISAGFINLPPDRIQAEIDVSLKQIAQALNLDNIALAEFSGETYGMVITHLFGHKKEQQISGSQINVLLPWYAKKILRGEEIISNNILEEYPEKAKQEREWAREQGMTSDASFPLRVADQIVGCISFSSLSQRMWTDELTRQLRLLAEIFGNTLHRKQIHAKMQDLLDFERMASDISALFVNIQADEVDQTIHHGLESIGTFMDADRCSLYQLSKPKTAYRITHTWVKQGAELAPAVLHSERLPWTTQKWTNREAVLIENTNNHFDEAKIDLQTFKEFGVGSHLSVPLAAGRAVTGALSMVTIGRCKEWPDEYVQRMKILGRIFANALNRKKTEQQLKSAFSKIKQLKERLEADYCYLRDEIKLEHNFEEIIGQSDALKYVLFKIEQISHSDVMVLIQGETGTGKELVARAIHNASPRNDRPLVKVNCATLPATLIESELFGYEKGAFTGANAKQIGRFGLADGGTLFLDEIGELPLELQPKLLRVLQDGEFERLGNPRTVNVDVRIIAATNRNLENEVLNGRFRQDLLYRLNVFPITVPTLRERREDIPMLVEWFVNKFAKKMGKKIRTISQSSLRALQTYSWPGNIRELQNIIERAVLNTYGPILQLEDKFDLPNQMVTPGSTKKTLGEIEQDHLLEMREFIIDILKECNWKIEGNNGAAQALGLNPGTLRSRMKKYGIKKP